MFQIRYINSNDINCLIFFVISKHNMQGFQAAGENKTAWQRIIIRIFFDYFALEDSLPDFFSCNTSFHHSLKRMLVPINI